MIYMICLVLFDSRWFCQVQQKKRNCSLKRTELKKYWKASHISWRLETITRNETNLQAAALKFNKSKFSRLNHAPSICGLWVGSYEKDCFMEERAVQSQDIPGFCVAPSISMKQPATNGRWVGCRWGNTWIKDSYFDNVRRNMTT